MTYIERNNNPQAAKIAGKAAFGPQPLSRPFGAPWALEGHITPMAPPHVQTANRGRFGRPSLPSHTASKVTLVVSFRGLVLRWPLSSVPRFYVAIP